MTELIPIHDIYFQNIWFKGKRRSILFAVLKPVLTQLNQKLNYCII